MTKPDAVLNEASELPLEESEKAKRFLMEHSKPLPDRWYYFANEVEIGDWEFVCLLKLNRIEIIRLQPIPLTRRRRR